MKGAANKKEMGVTLAEKKRGENKIDAAKPAGGDGKKEREK